MKGKLTLQIVKRIVTDSKRIRDKYEILDKVEMYSLVSDGKRYMKVISVDKGFRKYIISRDELAFIKVIFSYYGPGDYCIKFWSKGKIRGLRVFWDGLITKNKKFIRRIEMGSSIDKSYFQKEGLGVDRKTYIGNYMKTKQPGRWYNF